MPAATNALKYQQGYIQSNTERYIKFRDEAYKELMDEYGNDIAAKKLLQAREKELLDAIAKQKEIAADVGKGMTELEYLTRRASMQDAVATQNADAAKRRINIEQGKKGEFSVPTAVANKISEVNQFLLTDGKLITTPADAEAAIMGQINEVAQTWTAGQRSALAAAQQLYNVITTSSVYNNLAPAQKAQIVGHITDRAGLATLNVETISGQDLLTSPLDQLVKIETDAQMKRDAAAYSGPTQQTIKMLDDAWARQKEAKEAGKPVSEVQSPEQKALEEVQSALKAEGKRRPTEAEVRALAREKFEPEASDFLRKQFERDRYAGDADQSKLIHYDAIQAAKKMKLKEDSDVYQKAKMLVDTENKAMSPSQIRNAALKIAVDYSGGDIKKRDQFLENYHAIKIQEEQAKYAPQKLVEPVRADIVASESSSAGRLSGTPGPRGIVPTNEEGYALDEAGRVREPRIFVPPVLRERGSPGFLLDRISGGINRLAMSEDVQSPTFAGQEYGEISPAEEAQIIEAEKMKQRQDLSRRIVGIGATDMRDLFKLDI